MNLRDMTNEQLLEESLIDLAYAILEERKSAIQFNDLIQAIQALNGMSDAKMKTRLLQFYTDLNVEGRFLLNQENGWGLREWYKVETIEEETAPTVKARKKKSKAVADEDEELMDLDEEDVIFEEDFEEFADEEEIEEDLDFVEEEIEDIDSDIDEEVIVEDDGFIIESEDDEDDEDEEESDLEL